MAEKERIYNVPLRKEWLKVPIYERTPKAVRALKEFMQKHMKTEDVKLGKYLNKELWKRGNRHPPHKVNVTAKWVEEKDKKYVEVELVGAPEEEKKEEEKKKGLLGKLKGKKKEEAKEEKKEEKKEEEAKPEKKEEVKKEEKKEEKPAEKKETKKTPKEKKK